MAEVSYGTSETLAPYLVWRKKTKMKALYRGTCVSFEFYLEGTSHPNHKIMLVESFDKGFVFQIVCIKGFHSGMIEGMIREETAFQKAISVEHLKRELKRNFGEIIQNTLKIEPTKT